MADRIKAIEEKLDLLSTDDKISFIKRMIEKERLKYWKVYKGNIDSIIEALNDIYPGNWDFGIAIIEDYKLYFDIEIIIRFPKLIVSNGRQRQPISDMFVKFAFYESSNSLSLGNFYGTRMTRTIEELISNYSFSHLSNSDYNDYIDWGVFCLGSGEINQTMSMLSTYKPGIFRLFLFQLETYLSWESLSGRPYKYMRDIKSNSDLDPVVLGLPLHFYNELVNTYKTTAEVPPLSYYFDKGKIRIKDDHKFDKFIKFKGNDGESYSYSYPYNLSNGIALRDSEGNYFNVNIEANTNISSYNHLLERKLPFRGQVIPFTIIQTTTAPNISDKEIHIKPQIRNYVRERLEYNINKKRLKVNIINKLNSLSDTRAYNEADKISV